MTPFKGPHLKHRKEGTEKCHTVSRDLSKTPARFLEKIKANV